MEKKLYRYIEATWEGLSSEKSLVERNSLQPRETWFETPAPSEATWEGKTESGILD